MNWSDRNIVSIKSMALLKMIVVIFILANGRLGIAQVTITVPSLTLTACNSFPTSVDTLGDIIITENNSSDVQSSGSLELSIPSTFQIIDPGTITSTNGDISGISISQTSNTSLSISFTVNDTLQLDTLVLRGVLVRGILSATPASNIVNSGGTGLIVGDTVGSVHGIVTSTNAPALISTSLPAAICSGTVFNYQPISSVANTTFTWSRSAVTGISNPSQNGNDSIAELLDDTLSIPVNAVYTYLLSANGCNNTSPFNVSVTVNPIPVFTSSTALPAICSGDSVNYYPTSSVNGTVFSWSRAGVAGISNGSASGNGDIHEQLVDTLSTDVMAIYDYSLSANGCINSTLFHDSVTLHASPKLTVADTVSICNGVSILLPLTSTVLSTYTWSVTDNSHVNGEAIGVQITDSITDILVNDTTNYQQMNYAVIPTSDGYGCLGTTKNVVVMVTPNVVLESDSVFTICSGDTLVLPFISNVDALFTWSAADNLNTTGESVIIQQSDTLKNAIINNSTVDQVVLYSVTPTGTDGTCLGSTQSINVTVNPAPVVTNISASTLCSGSVFNAALTSNIPANYTWLAASNNDVMGESITIQNDSVISDTLVNTTSVIQTVSYQIIPIALNTGCNGVPFIYDVTLNPSPIADAGPDLSICSGGVDTIGVLGVGGYWYDWNTAQYLSDSTIANPIVTPSNNDTLPLNVTYVLTVTNLSTNCVSLDTLVVAINPQPILVVTNPTTVCAPAVIDLTDPAIVQGSSLAVVKTYFADSLSTTVYTNPNAVATSDTAYVKITAIGGCYDLKPVIININSAPIVNAGADVSFCSGLLDTIGVDSIAGYTYRWSPSAGLNDSTISNPTVTILNANPSPLATSYELRATIIATGCIARDTIIVTVNSQPQLMLNSPLKACLHDTINLTDTLLTVGSTSGTLSYWQNLNATDTLYMPNKITVSDTNYIKLTAQGGCADIKPIITIVYPMPIVSFSGLNTYNCLNASHQPLVGDPAGGVFSGNGIVGDAFVASIAGVGTQPITYTVTDSNLCSGSASQFIEIMVPGAVKPDICMATVNESSQNNVIYWNKIQYANVDSFIVYRETTPNLFEQIGSVSIDSLSMFVDTLQQLYAPNNGNPNDTSYRYKLQIRDTCGNYSDLSSFHRALHLSHVNETFYWNNYEIEMINPPISQLNSYRLMRDNNSTGNWLVVTTVAANVYNAVDPNYAIYPNARWRVETVWTINCSSAPVINTSRSNIIEQVVDGISIMDSQLSSIIVFPNPYSDEVNYSYVLNQNAQVNVALYSAVGQLLENVTTSMQLAGKHQLSINTKNKGYGNGIYFLKFTINGKSVVKQIVAVPE